MKPQGWEVVAPPTPLPYLVPAAPCRDHRLLAWCMLLPLGVSLSFAGTRLLSAMVARLGPCGVALSVAMAAGAWVAISATLGPDEPSPHPLICRPDLQDDFRPRQPLAFLMQIYPICGHLEPFSHLLHLC